MTGLSFLILNKLNNGINRLEGLFPALCVWDSNAILIFDGYDDFQDVDRVQTQPILVEGRTTIDGFRSHMLQVNCLNNQVF